VVSALVAFLSAYLAPKGLRELRNWAVSIKTDLLINIIQPGRFSSIERGLTFHIRERRADGRLLGIFIDDRRDPKERVTSISEMGDIVESARGTFLLLTNGSVHRLETGKVDPTIVKFERYAFDLSRFAGGQSTVQNFGPRERNLWDLAVPDPADPVYRQMPTQFRNELHDRIVAPLYPIAFTVLCFAILGAPRTSRQSRELSLIMAIVAGGALRLLGFACNVFAAQTVVAIFVLYGSILVALVLGALAIARGAVIEPPAFMTQGFGKLFERLSARLAPT
jgi:lipopolysaccharide export system permease protein